MKKPIHDPDKEYSNIETRQQNQMRKSAKLMKPAKRKRFSKEN